MDSLIRATCPSCHAAGDIPGKFIGHSIRCRKCGTNFVVKAPPKPPSLNELDLSDDIHLLPQTEEELAHESRVAAKSARLKPGW